MKLLRLLMASIFVFSFFTSIAHAVPSEQGTADCLMEYVNRFMERRNQPLVKSTQAIVPLVVNTENRLSWFGNETIIKESQAIFSREVETAKELSHWRDFYVLQWGGYSHFDMELTLLTYDISTDNAILSVRELTKLYFAKELGPNLEYTAWQINRIFVFERDASDWVLVL